MTDYYSGLFASTIDQQFTFFVKALLFGFALGALYDILKIYRIAFKCNKAVLIIQDIVYSVVIALLTFGFALILNNGKVRIYLIISHLLGAVIYRLSLSKIIMAVFVFIINLIKRFLGFLKRKILIPVKNKILNNLKKILKKIKIKALALKSNKKVKNRPPDKNKAKKIKRKKDKKTK